MGRVLFGDSRETLKSLPARSVQVCVTSPPYFGLRSYLPEAHPDKHLEIGQERTPEEFIAALVEVFREVRRVLADDGTLWMNLGDSYAGSTMTGGNSGINAEGAANGYKQARQFKRENNLAPGYKPKDLMGIPWRAALALQADGWFLRQDIIWSKRNCMPESVTDRCTKAHEYIFLLSKQQRYYFDHDAIKERQADSSLERAKYGWNGRTDDNSNGARTGSSFKKAVESGELIKTIPANGMRNRRSVWEVATQPYHGAHFACFPPALIEPCILAGSRPGDTALDPFFGSGTVGQVAEALGRDWIGCDLNNAYHALQLERTAQMGMLLA